FRPSRVRTLRPVARGFVPRGFVPRGLGAGWGHRPVGGGLLLDLFPLKAGGTVCAGARLGPCARLVPLAGGGTVGGKFFTFGCLAQSKTCQKGLTTTRRVMTNNSRTGTSLNQR